MYKPVERRYIIDDLLPLLIGIVIAAVFFFIGRYSMKDSYNPRKAVRNNNIDTIYFIDTAYVVRIYIDSVFEVDEEDGNRPIQSQKP